MELFFNKNSYNCRKIDATGNNQGLLGFLGVFLFFSAAVINTILTNNILSLREAKEIT